MEEGDKKRVTVVWTPRKHRGVLLWLCENLIVTTGFNVGLLLLYSEFVVMM
jgi:hypothetical protein